MTFPPLNIPINEKTLDEMLGCLLVEKLRRLDVVYDRQCDNEQFDAATHTARKRGSLSAALKALESVQSQDVSNA